ncbi:transcriptional regulator with GAF, ATPase, and Fis domain [Geodermatophilus bullaregiensis]|uniref:GAF and ANTAR domain-containing protein n=1 Tax=Geodermatophilus bullaregiensis TaxID=1564160 RepID=UPI0019560BB9|nr:GAF and ANTAR domain-containing protein [Geodermatophilus bullaregiensis]MBM7807754.1 transcriptional regulator with GAF, ATPase, and Fis domain [Geodermatophilus bullaregiensis]
MAEARNFDERFAAVARGLVNEPKMRHLLQQIAELVAADLDGEAYASVSLVARRREVLTAAASDERAARADRLQYEAGQGPCLDALWEQDTVRIDDLASEQRYRDWARRVAAETGIRSSLSLRLCTTADGLGVLNLYSSQPKAFHAQTRGEGPAFATRAAVALRSAQPERHLRATTSHHLISQAQGILMERFQMTAEQALTVLTRASQDANVELRDLAQHLIDMGDTPGR